MKISGIQKLSLVDFDGHISATIFLSGCNFACPFCHNSGLVKNSEPEISENEILNYLIKRKNMLDAVCISGGEPTLYKDLPTFIEKIKKLGYLVKLDTNGTNPNMIKELYQNRLIDYIAMDIKGSPEKYNLITASNVDFGIIKESIEYIMSCGIDYEFRTTLVEGFHEKSDMEAIGKLIKHARKYYLQRFEDNGSCIQNNLSPIKKDEALEFQSILSKNISNVKLRGY